MKLGIDDMYVTIKQIFSWSVYWMNLLLSMLARVVKKPGYLLVELMIALATIALCSVLVAQLQVHMVQQYHEAEQYFKAVTIANSVFAKKSFDQQEVAPGYTVNAVVKQLDHAVSYLQATVTGSWKTGRGISKQITIHVGMLDDEA